MGRRSGVWGEDRHSRDRRRPRAGASGSYTRMFARLLGPELDYVVYPSWRTSFPSPSTRPMAGSSRPRASAPRHGLIRQLESFLRAVVADGVRSSALCGHQVLASALGARVRRRRRWGVGPHDYEVLERLPGWRSGRAHHLERHAPGPGPGCRPVPVSWPGPTSAARALAYGDHAITFQAHPGSTTPMSATSSPWPGSRIPDEARRSALAAMTMLPRHPMRSARPNGFAAS